MRNFCSNICFSGILTGEHNLCRHWCSPPGRCPSWFPHVTYFDTQGSQAAEDAGSRDKLVEPFISIEHFFRQLEVYTDITPTVAMTENLFSIMVEVLSILAIATEKTKSGRISESMLLIFTILN
jgi:hypothetical protein